MQKNDMSFGVGMVARDSLKFSQSTPPWSLFDAILIEVVDFHQEVTSPRRSVSRGNQHWFRHTQVGL